VKLSTAIEKALTYGYYHRGNPFMCNAMYTMGLSLTTEQSIQAMVNSIAIGDDGEDLTLSHAVKKVKPEMKALLGDAMFQYTTQLYCWWVFDLKRKGL